MPGTELPSKREIRKAMRERRQALSAIDQCHHALLLRDIFRRLTVFQQCKRIALYRAVDGELDTGPLIRLCWRTGKEVYLPCLAGPGAMIFRRFEPGDSLQRSRLGLKEPRPSAPRIEVARLDLVCAPLVAFTDRGARLGMGGGYYDRTFSARLRRGHRPVGRSVAGPLLLGVAHSCQRLDALPGDRWDVPMHGFITELGPTGPGFSPTGPARR